MRFERTGALAGSLAKLRDRELIAQVVMALTHETLTHETRRALAERVQRRVEGRGIPRHVIDDAVARVGDALDRHSSASVSEAPAGLIVAVFTVPSAPDLGSRVRAALEAEAVVPLGMGTGTSGRHTVATVRIGGDARAAAERVASRLSASVSFVPESSTLSFSQ